MKNIQKEKSKKKKKRILLVDDDKTITLALSKAMTKTNDFEVDSFNDAETSLSQYKPRYYDLILLDVMMPKLNGFELYDQLKKRKLIDKERICFITGHEVYYETLKKDFPRLKVGCFIRKPIEIDALVKKIKDELNL